MNAADAERDAAAGLRFLEDRAAGFSLRTKLELGALALIAAAAALYLLTRPPALAPEIVTAAPQMRQADGSVIAERAPDAHPPPARHAIPRGYVEERRESIHVTPDADKKDVQVDLSIVRKGGERRVIASSPDGQVVSAIDIPIDPAPLPAPALPWAAGLSYGTGRSVGLWVDRDIGRLRVGVAAQRLADGRAEAQVRVGVRW